MRALFLFLLIILYPVAALAGADDRLIIKTRTDEAAFSVEIADTPEKRSLGLMYRTELAADAGMLFDFSHMAPVAMWMKNTYIPLDIVFINADGVIVNIVERAIPETLTPIHSRGPVLAVLELNSGTCARKGIRPGDKVLHPLFQDKGLTPPRSGVWPPPRVENSGAKASVSLKRISNKTLI